MWSLPPSYGFVLTTHLRLLGAAEAHREVDVVQQASLEGFGLDAAGAPLGVRIGRASPHRRRVGLLLDEERSAGLRRVLAGHVEREHVLHALGPFGIGGEPLAAAANLVDPEEGQRAPGRLEATSAGGLRQCCRQCQQRPAPASIVVRARLLDVRRHDDALVGLRGSGNLGDERPVRDVVERGFDVDLELDGSVLQPLAHAGRGPPARLESEPLRVGVIGHRAPLEHVVLIGRGEARRIRWADVRRDAGRDHAQCAPGLHGVLPEAAHVRVSKDDRSLHVEGFVLRGLAAVADIDEPRRHPTLGRRKGVDAERYAVPQPREQHLAVGERHRADLIVPAARLAPFLDPDEGPALVG